MNLINVGKIVNTHGLKGEVRILSNFKYKEDIFKIGNYLYIKSDKLAIKTYRKHKNYDMITFENIESIDDVIKYKNEEIYIDRNLIKNVILDEELIGYNIYQNDVNKGIVKDLKYSKLYTLLVIEYNGKEYLVPNTNKFVLNIDKEKKIINIIDMIGLIDEN